MEHAPLRPVPARPAGPIDPATATREVAAWLPLLSPPAAQAFALVALAERPRSEVAETLAVSELELSGLLAAARKELRQTTDTLAGSGWCERAERLISDRLDGTLADTGARRLDVHLRNCPRCVEHERRLVQATDALILSVGGAIGAGGRGTPTPPLTEAPPEDAPLEEIPQGPDERALEAVPDDAGAPTADDIAAAVEVLVAVRTRRQLAAAIAWKALLALAVLLAVVVIAITVAGALGANL